MANKDMVIFTRAFDFIDWLIPRVEGFPRSQRFGVTKRLQDAALNFYERLFEANRRRGVARLDKLNAADAELDKVRHYLRLVTRWDWLSGGQYRHAAGMVAELGRLLGGWIRQTREALAEQGARSKGAAGVARRGVQQHR
jgi:four helix bundle protein